MKALIAALLAYASHASGLHPVDQQLPHWSMWQPVCVHDNGCAASRDPDAETEALYYPSEHMIYLAPTFDPSDPFDRSVLAHELVHYLQDRNGQFEHSCAEPLAYRVQLAYMRKEGLDPLALGFTSEFLQARYDEEACTQ